MRYHHEQPAMYSAICGKTYICDHVVYNRCTLYEIGDIGLAVIQQRYDPITKHTYWSEIDPWLVNELYLHDGFYDYFKKKASLPLNGIYPTVSVRQIMWALKIKPIKKESWETVFDHSPI